MKTLIQRKHLPLALCLVVGSMLLMTTRMVVSPLGRVCVIRRDPVHPVTMEIEEPDSFKLQRPARLKFVEGEEIAELFQPPDNYHDDFLGEDPDDPVVGNFDVYPDATLEKYGLTDEDCNCSGRYDSTTVRVKYVCMHPDGQLPLVTMFTTMGDDPGRENVHSNTIRTWAKLDRVRTILFVTCSMIDSEVVVEACREGWHVALVPSCESHDLPVLRTMFLAAEKTSYTPFYGYANADILFTESLVETLEFLQFQIERNEKFQENLIIGGRINLNMDSKLRITSLQQVEDLAAVGQPSMVAFIDYFISSSNGYPWETIPPLVVGRRAYDNWLVLNARKARMATFDATDAIVAAHQNGPGIPWEPHTKRQGANINMRLIGEDINLLDGLISCTRFKIRRDLESNSTRLGLYWRRKAGFCGRGAWRNSDKWAEIVKRDGFRKLRLKT